MRTWAVVLSSAVLLLAAAAPAQDQPSRLQPLPTFRAEIDVVNIIATVRDKNGRLIPDLKKEDFILLEDGKEQPIRYFRRETDLPLTIGMLVDTSRSQWDLIGTERDAARTFFYQAVGKEDKAFLVSFDTDSALLQDFTNSPRQLTKALEQLVAPIAQSTFRIPLDSGVAGAKLGQPASNLPANTDPGSNPAGCSQLSTVASARGTVLHEAVYLAAGEKLRRQPGRKMLIILTDGVDQGSRLKIEDAVRAALRADAAVYSIQYYDPNIYCDSSVDSLGNAALHKLSDVTGGHVYKVERKNSLEVIFSQIQEEMRHQYAIGFSPLNSMHDGSYRRLEVRTVDLNLSVQARQGYYALKPEARQLW